MIFAFLATFYDASDIDRNLLSHKAIQKCLKSKAHKVSLPFQNDREKRPWHIEES